LVPRRDGRLTDIHATTAKALLAEARQHGVSTAIAIGGANGSHEFYAMLFDPPARARFVTELEQMLATYPFDGVVLDMEYWPRPDVQDVAGGSAYLSLIQEVAALMRARKGFVSVAVFGSAWFGKHYPAAIVDVVDAFEIMAYDFSGSWSPAPEPHASYEQAHSALTYWSGRVGKQRMRKAYLGIPFYGKCFPHPFTPGDPVRNLAYHEIVPLCAEAPVSDTCHSDSCTVYYNGHATLRKKAALVKEHGLAGVSVWEITMDAPSGPDRLLPALISALR
jgi:GH18 family chitinase